MQYIAIIVILTALILIYFRIADKYNIIDKPNSRSSHSYITIRGGGIVFPIAVIMSGILGSIPLLVVIGIVLAATVSFIDDLKPLHQLPRFSSHMIAVLFLLYVTGILSMPMWLILVVIICAIGWINAFNFMDGINGITVLYSLVNLITFAYLFKGEIIFESIVIMGLACLVFGYFNLRKRAKTFAGDVGSISMAIFLAYIMLHAIFNKEQIGYLLFFSIYGFDAIITILFRLKNKENIFEAHRSHLYQYLANELKWSHIKVSVIYAVAQFVVNICTILLINKGYMSIPVFLLIGFFILTFYLMVRVKVQKQITSKL